MDKNQSVIIMIIAVLIAVCIFLYFVFRPSTDEPVSNMEEGTEEVFDISVDENFQVDEQDDVIAAISSDTGTVNMDQNSSVGSRASNTASASSPDTGPGTIALFVAFSAGIVIMLFGRSVFRKFFL